MFRQSFDLLDIEDGVALAAFAATWDSAELHIPSQCAEITRHLAECFNNLTSDKARRIVKAIARLPEFLIQRHGFYQRGDGFRWRPQRSY